RAIKSDREIAQVRHAANIVQHGLESIAQMVPSVGESRVAAEVMREVRVRGAEDIRLMIARLREAASTFRPIEDVSFNEGDIVSVLLSTSWERYWSESIRTFRVVAERFEPMWPAGLGRFHALTSRLKPGVTTGEWSRATFAAMTAVERGAIAPYGLGDG